MTIGSDGKTLSATGTEKLDGTAVVVVAAGQGQRMTTPGGTRKQFLEVLGQPLFCWSLATFMDLSPDCVILVVPEQLDSLERELLSSLADSITVVAGGKSRAESVTAGLDELPVNVGTVMVHDAARPCVRTADILKLKEQTGNDPAGGVLAVPVYDTVKQLSEDRLAGQAAGTAHRNLQTISHTVDRSMLWLAQTPQFFPVTLIRHALGQVDAQLVTDEASAMEMMGYHPRLVEGHSDNIKVTRPDDIGLVTYQLKQLQKDRLIGAGDIFR